MEGMEKLFDFSFSHQALFAQNRQKSSLGDSLSANYEVQNSRLMNLDQGFLIEDFCRILPLHFVSSIVQLTPGVKSVKKKTVF